MATLAFYLLTCISLVAADYACVCNYNVEEVIHGEPVPTGTTLGYMYEFDCRERFPMANLDSSWFAVAVEHRIGYVHSNGQVQIQICQGNPPIEDKVTTTSAATLTMTTAKPSKSTITTHIATAPNSTTSTPSPTTVTLKPTTTTSKQTTITTAPKSTTTTPKPATTTATHTSTITIARTTSKQTTKTTTSKPTTTTATATPQPTTATTTPSSTTTTSTTTPIPISTTTTPIPTTTPTTPKPTTTKITPKPTTTTTTPMRTTTPTTTTITLKPTTTTATTTPKPTTTTATTTPRPTTLFPQSTTFKPTTTRPTPTTTETLTTTTHKPVMVAPKTTHKQFTRVPTIPISNSPCYSTYNAHQSKIKGPLLSYGHTCYEFVTGASLWSSAEYDCRAKGGHLARIANSNEQAFIYNYLHSHNNHPVWIGLRHAQLSGFHINLIHWIPGGVVSYIHWSPSVAGHIQHNCVVLDPADHGYWKDEDCETVDQNHHGYVCQYGGSSFTLPPTHVPTTRATTPNGYHGNPDGNTRLCTQFHQSHAQRYSSFLAQYGSSCYELVPNRRITWQHAEAICEQGHGHLVHITSADEQAFVQSFLQRHFRDHAVWIGLHDLMQEGKYEWSSGRWVTYTNFLPNHLNNHHSRYLENCFVIIPYKDGQWDDTDCGTNLGSIDYGSIYPPFCQFPIASATLIG